MQGNYQGRTFSKESGAKIGLEKKQKFISSTIDKKEASIRESSIRRDAALFASVSAKHEDRESLENEYKYWTLFFENVYNKPEEKPVEDDIKIEYEQNTN
ncbi:MAG: hypothetical protein IPM48_14625 [Saprospiraceae bacterium]|nr:hypothetical protein [Saprospiraceae bacterium]